MAGDYTLTDAAEGAPTRFEKFLRVFIILAVCCLGVELVWLLGITPFRPFSRIDIAGAAEDSLYYGISREQLFARAGISGASSYFSTDVRSVEEALSTFASLASVRVFKSFPDRLQIVLEGRQAAASVLAAVNGRTVPVLFDSQGVIFRIGGDGRDEEYALPVISGLVIEEPFPGMRLPALPFFGELEKIRISSPELLTAVSEIRVNRKAFNSFDLVLYPLHRRIKVRLSELNEDLLRYALLMVDVLASQGNGIDTLDFRSGIASYIPKEVSPE